MFFATLFSYGLLAGCAGLLLQVLSLILLGGEASFTSPTPTLIILAAIIEETIKLIFLWQAHRRFGHNTLSIPALVVFGLGFAFTELSLILFLPPQDHSPLILIGGNTLAHIVSVLFLGMALRYFSYSHRVIFSLLVLISSLHALYNFARLQG